MNWFGRKSAGRAPARPVLSHGLGTWIVGEWPRSYEGQVREGYLGNAVAQRSVRLVAEGVASATLSASDPAALALVKATSGGQALIEALALNLLLHGNGYVQLLCDGNGEPTELFALRPERVSVEPDARGWPLAFLYRVGETVLRIPADQMIHIRSAHPLDDHYGLGCLGAASGPIAIHNAATKWNKALLDNAARPSGALVYAPGDASALSGEQFERLRSELAESFSGSSNAGRPMLLEGGLSWQAMSLTPAEMDFAGLKAAAAREIALAFGVPPMLLGLPGDATYANYREANKALWRLTILPLAGKIASALAEGLRPWFTGLELTIEMDAIPALSEDRERLWAQVGAADFLTLDEKRAMVGLEALDLGGAEAVLKETSAPDPIETKYNHQHDRLGRFTYAGMGFRGGGGSFGGAGASGSWDEPVKPKPALAKPAHRKPVSVVPISTIPPPKRTTTPKPSKAIRPITRVTSGGYDFDMGVSKRTERVNGELKQVPEQTRSRAAQRRAGGSERLPSDHGGHYIAREFGGPEKDFNHFAQDAKFNKSDYRKLELQWGKLMREGRKVKVDILPRYGGDAQRPIRIDVTYHVDGERHFKGFRNARRGN